MATRVYTWTDGGGTGAWNNASNWSGVGSGYPGSNSPTDTDSVIFDSTSTNDCSMNATTTINLMLIDTGYTGTITQTQGLTIDDAVLGGHLTINEGTLDTDGNGLYIDGDVEIDGSSSLLDASGGGAVQMRSLQTTGGGDYSATDHLGGTVITGRNADTNRGLNSPGENITHNEGLFVIQGTSAGNTDISVTGTPSSTLGLYDLEIDATTYTIALNAALDIYNDFTITKGTFTTAPGATDYALTVGGTTTIGSADASAVDEATLITNESAIDLQGTDGSAPGLEMLAGGTFNGVGDANHSIGGVKALTTTYNSKIYLTSGTTTINQEMDSNMAWQTYSTGDVNLYHGNGTLKFTAPGYAFIYNNGQDFYDMIVDHAGAGGQLIALSLDLQIANDLTVSDGDFLKGDGKVLTVGNNCLVSGGAHSFTAEGGAFTVVNALIIGDDSSLTATDSTLSLGNLFMKSGSTFSMPAGTTTVTANGSNATGRTWYTRTNNAEHTVGPRTLTIPSGSTLSFAGNCTFEFDNSQYFYNISGAHIDTKNSHLHIDNNFSASGWGPNGYTGYHWTCGNDFTVLDGGRFNTIDTGSTWTISGNVILNEGSKWDVHGSRTIDDVVVHGDVNVKIYGNLINKGGYIY